MTFRKLCCGTSVVVFACGVLTAGEAYAQRRDGNLLPQTQSGMVTAAGCLMRGAQVRGGDKDNYALSNPRKGPVGSVPEGTCSADAGAPALDLKDGKENGITDAMIGRWVEVTGELEKETSKDPDDLRELDVRSAKLIAVVPPPTPVATSAPAARRSTPSPVVAASEPTPTPTPMPAAAPAPAARTLPKTASNAPAMLLGGLLMLAAAFALRAFRVAHPQ